jgi:hypothetical protein
MLGYSAIAVFFYGVYVQIRKYRRGAALALDGLSGGGLATWPRRCSVIAPIERRDRRPAARTA